MVKALMKVMAFSFSSTGESDTTLLLDVVVTLSESSNDVSSFLAPHYFQFKQTNYQYNSYSIN